MKPQVCPNHVSTVPTNSGVDLDSMTSSLLFAYFRSTAPPAGSFSPLYIPIVNIPASEIRLRPEFVTVCESGGITTSHLLSLDDIRPGFKHHDDTSWILVDHNKLQGSLGKQFSDHVRGVIDHHEEEHSVPLDTSPEPRIVHKAGSCTSLVINYCKASWDAISDASLVSGAGHAQGEMPTNDAAVTRGWDAQLAKFALASILIDTANLKAPGRVEPVDREVVDFLESKILLSAKDARTWNRDEYFELVAESMQDISHLTLEEILIKDYKEWTENGRKLGTSSSMKPLTFLVQKSHEGGSAQSFDDTVGNFMKSRQMSVFAIMTWYRTAKGEFRRELLVQDAEPEHKIIQAFSTSANRDLDLKELDLEIERQTDTSNSADWRNFWSQGDMSKSRKQIAPMLRDAMKK